MVTISTKFKLFKLDAPSEPLWKTSVVCPVVPRAVLDGPWKSRLHLKQESIPVGWVQPACRPGCPECVCPGVCVCVSRQGLARGMCIQDAGVSSGGCVSRGRGVSRRYVSGGVHTPRTQRHTFLDQEARPPPSRGQTDTCENISFPQLRWQAVMKQPASWQQVSGIKLRHDMVQRGTNLSNFLIRDTRRMHSSRMRTAGLLTVSHSIPCISGGICPTPSDVDRPPGCRLPPPGHVTCDTCSEANPSPPREQKEWHIAFTPLLLRAVASQLKNFDANRTADSLWTYLEVMSLSCKYKRSLTWGRMWTLLLCGSTAPDSPAPSVPPAPSGPPI